jgi:ribosomal protein S13
MNNWANELTELFQRKKSKWRKRTHEEMLNILAIKKMQIKTTLRFHLTPVRIATIKNTKNNKCWRGCREKGTLIHCW